MNQVHRAWGLPIAFIALLALTLSLGGCGSQGGEPASSGETIPVGGYLSLSGDTATFGTTTRDGMLLAAKQINDAGGIDGKKLELIIHDDRGLSQEVGSIVTRLITSDGVVAVIGEVASSLSLAAAPVCQQMGVPMISPSSTNEKVTQVGDMIFRVCFIDAAQGYGGAKFAFDNLNARKVAVLYDQKQAYSQGLKDEFMRWYKQMGGTITTEQAYSSGTTDFSAQLGNIKASAPDAIYVPGYYKDVGIIALQARQQGIDVPLIGGDGWESEQLIKIGGQALEGCYYTNHYAPEVENEKSKKFVAEYTEAYGHAPGALAALGYDAVMVLAEAIKASPSLKGEDLARAIARTKDYEGVTGTTTIDANRNAQKSMVILEIKGGKPVYVTTIDPPPA